MSINALGSAELLARIDAPDSQPISNETGQFSPFTLLLNANKTIRSTPAQKANYQRLYAALKSVSPTPEGSVSQDIVPSRTLRVLNSPALASLGDDRIKLHWKDNWNVQAISFLDPTLRPEELEGVPGVGPAIAQAIFNLIDLEQKHLQEFRGLDLSS